MGLLDVLHGMANGPRGPATPSAGQGRQISPLAMGLLAMLAYKTFKGEGPLGGLLRGSSASPSAPTSSPGTPAGGGLMNWLQAGQGGAVGSGAAGSIVSGGLTELVKRLEQNGLGDVGHSWVGTGPNKSVSPGDLEQAAGPDTLNTLAKEIGMPIDQLLQRLQSELPETVDKLTPNGRIPTQQEAANSI